MQQSLSLKILPSEASDSMVITKKIAEFCGKAVNEITGFHLLKKSIDARAKMPLIQLSLLAFINEPFLERKKTTFHFHDVTKAKKNVIIIGTGPAGLAAALLLIERGIKPILLERGKDVRARRRDLAVLNKEGLINPNSNYCFGEGGAGTYSDGKLYTRSNKRGNIERILNLFVHFGAEENILFDAHPHIGTNKLPAIIIAMRQLICDCGGEFHFDTRVIDFVLLNDSIKAVKSSHGDEFKADAFILATGHSARDIFTLLYQRNIKIEARPFALGVRIEHPQSLIDNIQYNCLSRGDDLPPASYSLVQQVNDKGVFSFCMCPGGIIAPASTSENELVVNGWSPSRRNNIHANSGMVVQVEIQDAINELLLAVNDEDNDQQKVDTNSPLLMMHFQQLIEKRAFTAGGGKFVAPAQRIIDFTRGKVSSTLPDCSYVPGIASSDLNTILPQFIAERLSYALTSFGRKMKGYFTNEAVMVAIESRTSSPVRIPRDPVLLNHPQIRNLYPCGEGAGYAGGIVSAAMDGERVASAIVEAFSPKN